MSQILEKKFHDALLRQHLELFVQRSVMTLNQGRPYLPNWHISAVCFALEQVFRGEIKRLIINLPPRHLKSIIASVAYPAWVLGQQPDRRIVCLSYSHELVAKHASDFRAVAQSEWYWRIYPRMRILRTANDEVFTSCGGYRKAVSMFGTLTGFGGDLFIIDDPQKPIDAQSEALRGQVNQWFSNTLLSRLTYKEDAAIIVVMQRLHLDDLSGYLLQSGGWHLLSLPAIAEADDEVPIGDGLFYRRRTGDALHPAYESVETLRSLQRSMGSSIFSAQYQQHPIPLEGGMIKRSWLRSYDQIPDEALKKGRIIQSWDTASKEGALNDWSVCTTWLYHKPYYYLLDLVRGRYDYPKLKAKALALAEKYKPRYILIEDAAIGTALAQELKQIHFGSATRLIKPGTDKISRLYVNEVKFETGLVLFPRHAPFLAELEAELLTFPQSKHDDQVDSITQALSYEMSGYTLDYVR
jgi:predicted phage terminase large subunit-like protein